MALPAGALTATVTVGAAMAHDGTAGTLVSLRVRPDVPAGLVWAATGDMVEPWSATGAGTLTILADQAGVLTSGTVDGAPAMVAIRAWPLVAEWRTKPSANAAPTKHVRRLAAPAPGTTVDLDLLPQDGALPVATITTAQTINVGAGSADEIAQAVDDYLTANPPPAPVTSVNAEVGAVVLSAADVGADPAGTAAAAVAAHAGAVDPHPTYTTAAEAAAAAPVQSVAGRTGAVTLAVADVSGAVASTDPRLSDARTPTAHAASHATGQADALTPANIGAATAVQGALAATASQPGHTHSAAAISDSTAVGRSVLTAPVAAAARAAIGAGTSSLALGTTAGTALEATAAPELIRDTMGTALVAGANVTITPNDDADTITIAAGGTNAAVWLAGMWSDYISCPDSAALDITGDIDIRVKLARATWNATGQLVKKWWDTNQNSWQFSTWSGTGPSFTWSSTGSNSLTQDAGAIPPFASGETGWLRVTLDVDNGAGQHVVTFYTSTDGTAWTLLRTFTRAGTTSIFAGTSQVSIGNDSGGATAGSRFQRVEVRSGIGGTVVASWAALGSLDKYRDPQGNIWTVNDNAAVMEA